MPVIALIRKTSKKPELSNLLVFSFFTPLGQRYPRMSESGILICPNPTSWLLQNSIPSIKKHWTRFTPCMTEPM
jgi:hypothetical protein